MTSWADRTDKQKREARHLLCSDERSVYQSLMDRGYTHDEALNDALDGVEKDA